LKIPPETQTGKMFRLRGKGVKQVRGGTVGDMLCRVSVETPVNLTKRQKDLLKELQETLDSDGTSHQHNPKRKTWFDGVKTFFEDMKI
jgi:molecular chaperone DnaJ